MDIDAAVALLAARLQGIVTRAELLALGASPDQINRRIRSRVLAVVHRGVYRHRAVAPSRQATVLAAVRAAGPGAVASHRSAAWLHGLRARPAAACEVLVLGDRHLRLAGVVAHRSDTLELSDLGTVAGIPVTAPARTLLDLGAVVPPSAVEAGVEAALLGHRCELADLQDVLVRLGGHGRAGAGVLRALLADRLPSTPAMESALEVALLQVLRRHGFPEPTRQYLVARALGRRARLDFAWPELRIGIEAEGRRWHTGRNFERDLARRNALTQAGWRLFHYGWAAVHDTPELIAAELWQARQLAARRAG